MNDKKIINAALWFFAVCVGVILLTSCNPYVTMPVTPTATPSPAATNQDDAHVNLIPTPTPRPACYVNVGAVYLRSGAGMSHAVTKVLHKAERLAVLERGDWLKVETSQHTRGWVYSKLCK